MEYFEALHAYIDDPNNPETNWNLARCYHELGQTASAMSFYMRTAERTKDIHLQYEALVLASLCFDSQGCRGMSVRSLLQHAMSLIPDRPEAHYVLARYYQKFASTHLDTNEGVEAWFYGYTFASSGYKLQQNKKFNPLRTNCDYPGEWALLFEQAVCAWWCGLCEESRQLFLDLKHYWWDLMDESHQISVDNNLRTLNVNHRIKFYKPERHTLRHMFDGYSKIQRNYSEAFQDLFVLSMLDGKRGGTYLEIGSGFAHHGNNTVLLEKEFGWTGIGVEWNPNMIPYHTSEREHNVICADARQIDYNLVLSEIDKEAGVIDYLQIDCDPPSISFDVLKKIPFDQYRFRVITFEHDAYTGEEGYQVRKESREYLQELGYELVVLNVGVDEQTPFEDWWVHPELIDQSMLEMFKNTDWTSKSGESVVTKPSIFNINKLQSPRYWVIDNFYEDPHAVREFALQQTYIEGGFGRGFIGRRTNNQFLFPGLKERFEQIMGVRIREWESHGMNGRFQAAKAGEPLVFHCDDQTWAGMLFLTPDAPVSCGTTAWKHKQSGVYHNSQDRIMESVGQNDTFLDRTPFEPGDVIGNYFNRLLIFDAGLIHSASEYFGSNLENSRLWQIFFFD